MLIVDWFMWQLPLERKFLDSEKNTLRDKLTTPNERIINF